MEYGWVVQLLALFYTIFKDYKMEKKTKQKRRSLRKRKRRR